MTLPQHVGPEIGSKKSVRCTDESWNEGATTRQRLLWDSEYLTCAHITQRKTKQIRQINKKVPQVFENTTDM